MNIKERIQTIEDNLAENERLFLNNKRDKRTYVTCKRDGKHRLAELRGQHRKAK